MPQHWFKVLRPETKPHAAFTCWLFDQVSHLQGCVKCWSYHSGLFALIGISPCAGKWTIVPRQVFFRWMLLLFFFLRFCVLCWTINYWRKWISDFHLWHCIFIFLLHRVCPGGKACSSTCHPVSVVIWLWELESVIRPTWVVGVYSTRISSPSIPSSSAPPGPHPASTASPSTSDCLAAQQCQCGHGKNQRR